MNTEEEIIYYAEIYTIKMTDIECIKIEKGRNSSWQEVLRKIADDMDNKEKGKINQL
jgi:hypothetical protein